MRVRRREMLHLLGAGGLVPLIGCGKDETTPAPVQPAKCDLDWWLCGNFAPVSEVEAVNLEVVGSLPAALRGVYVRNGPNPHKGSSDHWFVGDGMLHGVRIEGGKAPWYRARYVQTEVLDAPEDDTVGPPGLTEHQANTALLPHGDQILCLCEVGVPYAVTRADLATIGPYDFDGQLMGSMTAHPKVDPVTGEIVFFGYDFLSPSCRYYGIDSGGTMIREQTIELPSPVMMHDFQMTATHVLFMDLPVLFDIDLAVQGVGMPFSWHPENGARIGVMAREGGEVEWFDIEPCYVFHTFNAFHHADDPNKVSLDVIRYPEMWVESPHDLEANGVWWRYTMTLGTGEVTAEPMDDTVLEFPRIDARRQGVPHRHAYALSVSNTDLDEREFDSVVKYDVESGAVTRVVLPGMSVDEALFVPSGDDDADDAGWLLAYAHDRASDRSQLLVLEASDVEAGPIARVMLPQRVPHGFHGTWSPDQGSPG